MRLLAKSVLLLNFQGIRRSCDPVAFVDDCHSMDSGSNVVVFGLGDYRRLRLWQVDRVDSIILMKRHFSLLSLLAGLFFSYQRYNILSTYLGTNPSLVTSNEEFNWKDINNYATNPTVWFVLGLFLKEISGLTVHARADISPSKYSGGILEQESFVWLYWSF
jgi:hypothetical protein